MLRATQIGLIGLQPCVGCWPCRSILSPASTMKPSLASALGSRRTSTKSWLFSGSGVLGSRRSCHQGGDQFAEQGFAASAGVVDELKEAEVERQLLLRDAAVRPQPGA